MNTSIPIAFLGGSGRLGQALVARFSRAGFRAILGSRVQALGQKIVSELNHQIQPQYEIEAYDYRMAIEKAPIIFMTIPFPHSREIACTLVQALQSKILIDTSVPMQQAELVQHSAVAETQAVLGDHVQVVSAFQTVAASLLRAPHAVIQSNVLISGNDYTACQKVIALAKAIGLKGVYCGSIQHSLTTENLALTLMQMNRHYGSSHAGVDILL